MANDTSVVQYIYTQVLHIHGKTFCICRQLNYFAHNLLLSLRSYAATQRLVNMPFLLLLLPHFKLVISTIQWHRETLSNAFLGTKHSWIRIYTFIMYKFSYIFLHTAPVHVLNLFIHTLSISVRPHSVDVLPFFSSFLLLYSIPLRIICCWW